MAANDKVPDYLQTHQLHAALLRFGIPSEVAPLREEAARSGTGRAAKTLVKEGAIRVTLIALRQGVALEEHRVAGAVTIQVLHGAFRLSTNQEAADVHAGELVVLDTAVAHAAHALEDCVLLLTVAMAR